MPFVKKMYKNKYENELIFSTTNNVSISQMTVTGERREQADRRMHQLIDPLSSPSSQSPPSPPSATRPLTLWYEWSPMEAQQYHHHQQHYHNEFASLVEGGHFGPSLPLPYTVPSHFWLVGGESPYAREER